MNDEVVRETTIVDVADLEAIEAFAESHGVQLEELPSRDLEPVTTVTLIVIGTALAVGAVTSFIERRKGGQMIDLRPGAPRVAYRDKNVTYGLVIVLLADGTVSVEVKQPKDMFVQVVEAVLKSLLELGGGASVATVAAAVKAVAGSSVSVTESSHPAR